ncbi:hypothetical protein GGI07_004122 [Coemansia sp. Benny D115]|nr:hypothetical protein GGI07_004122 [Coemansia sp. Benny D115]
MSASNNSNGAAVSAPQPIPGATAQPQQARRSSFAGWSQSLFGMPPSISRTQTLSSPQQQQQQQQPASAFASAGANSLPETAASAFSGIGLFRRFSTSGAGNSSAGQSQQQQPQMPQKYAWPGAEQATHTQELDSAFENSHHQKRSGALGKDASGSPAQHFQPKVFDDIRAQDDPPSRPDSRMRNLMLSGQFLI